jgi:hypothetical protein
LHTFLRDKLAFSASDLARLDAGQIIVKLPKTSETREVAAFAITRLDVPGDFFIDRVRDIVEFKTGENVLQIGKSSDPPRIEDLAGLTLDQSDIEALRRCRVKSCGLKMSATFIKRLQAIDWSRPDHGKQVTVFVRAMLLEHVQTYLKSGNIGLGTYEDKSHPLGIASEVSALLKPASYMYGYLPEFQRYLEGYPLSRPGSSARYEDFLYWSKDDFGLKPVISVTHVIIYRPSADGGSDAIIASKGIYASHYFEASLGLTAFIRSHTSEPSRSYLIYVNRSRTDALRGLFAGFKRTLIGGRLRAGAEKNMEMIKQKLEEQHEKTAADSSAKSDKGHVR